MEGREQGRRSSARRARPVVEGLEGRQLLNARFGAAAISSFGVKRISYRTAEGSQVSIKLSGPGNLLGSSLDANGALRLVYDNSSPNTLIVGKIRGGSRTAPLASVDDADVPSTDFTGINGNLLNTVRLGDFDLVNGGAVNLTGGVGKLYLRSVGANTQVHLRDIPGATPVSNSIQLNSLTSPTSGLNGGPAFLGFDAPLIGTNNNNTPYTLPSVVNSSGRVLNYFTDRFGAVSLSGVGGQFQPTTNQVGFQDPSDGGPPPGIPGVLLQIGQIMGRPDLAAPALIDVQGNLQALKSGGVRGLVLNDEGDLGLVKIDQALDSTILGYPIGHIDIRQRQNVQIFSTARVVGDRGDVIVNRDLTPSGPLSLPLS